MITYLIESTACLAIMLLIYRFILSKTSLHQLKRFYLLACLVLPLTLPLLQFDLYYGKAPIIEEALPYPVSSQFFESNTGKTSQALESNEIVTTQETHAQSSINWPFWILSFYVLIIAILLIRFLTNIYRISRLARASARELYNDHKIFLLKGNATAYSFFQLIFIGEDDFKNPTTREHLLSHELAHAGHWHSADILLLEMLRVLLWFNPLYFLLSKYIRLNHEYIADSQVLNQFGDSQVYQKLILNFASRTSTYTPLVSPSDFSFIKNRFSMMHKSTSQKVAAIRVLLLITAIAGTFFSLAVELKPRPAVFAAPVQTTITRVTTETPTGIPMDSIKYSTNTAESRGARKLYFDDYYPGIDITARAGRTVIATADGTVLESGEGDKKYGNYVLIGHSNNIKTLYASLSKITTAKGQKVKRGDLLGSIGMTMRTSAIGAKVNRVHYAISKSGKWVDPYTYINLPTPNSGNEPGTVVPWAYPRALDIPTSRSTRPDISPLEANPGEYMAYTGMISGGNLTKSSIYDSALGTEFFSAPNTTIKATANGTVTEVVRSDEKYGTYIKIRHDDLHETMYAKLDEVLVQTGQTLKKGESIARIGKEGEMFGRLHYKVLRSGKSIAAGMYTSSVRSSGPQVSSFPSNSPKVNFSWNFPAGLPYKSISLNRDKAVFTKRSGEVVTKKATELSVAQKKALLGLKRPPFRHEARRPVPKEVYERWHNPKVYQIRIDGELVDNSEMTKYQPTDFAHSWWVVVGKATKALKGHAFELSLYTKEYYEKQKKDRQAHRSNWTAETKKLLSAFQGI
ncbi:MAG: peptidoglycan DD-metalloendopeptidase family protein [Roseivirga sp.]|nr:peptidoglycan DD-metalloendopeptidase family protein [Roseivirga sp.]